MQNTVKCSKFYHLSSDSAAVSFRNPNSQIFFINCVFLNVTSSSFPGCIFSSNADIFIEHCSFESCSATGGNTCYGNTCYFELSHVLIYSIQCFLSAPSFHQNNQKETGDSLISLRNCSQSNIDIINSSYCYGNKGSSSISNYFSTINSLHYTQFNIINSADYSSLELGLITDFNGYFMNIINTTKNTDYIILNDRSDFTLYQCNFINNFNKEFCITADRAKLIDCYSSSSFESISLAVTNEVITYDIHINNNIQECFLCYTHDTHSYFKLPHARLSIFIFILYKHNK